MAYDDVWDRRDVLGIHAQKQPGLYWAGAAVPAGRLLASDFHALADVADRWVAAQACLGGWASDIRTACKWLGPRSAGRGRKAHGPPPRLPPPPPPSAPNQTTKGPQHESN